MYCDEIGVRMRVWDWVLLYVPRRKVLPTSLQNERETPKTGS